MSARGSAYRAAVLILGLFLCGALALAQQTAAVSPPQPIASVPFELFHNRVYLPVEVNGQGPVEMILDTGAGLSGVGDDIAKTMHLQTGRKANLVGNGESSLKIMLAKDVTLRLGNGELVEKSLAVVPYEDFVQREGRRIGGVVGVNFFRRYIVDTDYGAKTVSVYEPRTFVYRGSGEKIPLRFDNAALFQALVEMPGRDPIPCVLAVDSGTYSTVRLYRPFLEKHHLSDVHGIESFGFGLGGEFPEKLGRIAALRIGSITLPNPVVSFSTAKSGATSGASYDGTIGGALLSRFRVIFDYPHQQMILEPIAKFAEPWAADTSGLILRAEGPDLKTISVSHVLSNTPAATAGMKVGDIIVKVDGQEASLLGLEGLRQLFTVPGSHRSQVRRGQQTLDFEVAMPAPIY